MLEKCANVLRVRKVKHFKYHDAELPTNVDEIYGFHQKCYNSFIALKTKYL